MVDIRSRKIRQLPKRTAAGFSLTEFLVSVAVLLIMIGTALRLLDQGQAIFMAQNAEATAQARARKAINLMAAEISLAGSKPVTITSGMQPGLHPVSSSLTASSTAIRVVADRDASGTTDGTATGGDGDINDDVTYSFSGSTIYRTAPNDPAYRHGSIVVPQPVIDGVSSLTISYFDANGNQLSAPINLSAVRRVRLVIITSVNQLGSQRGTVTVEANVALRNLQLGRY